MTKTGKELAKKDMEVIVIYLQHQPSPQFCICATKIFEPGEIHVTRRHPQSVLILMREGILRFREDGRNIELRPGEYYIQPQGMMQEGLPISEPPVYIYVEFNAAFSQEGPGLPIRGGFSAQTVLPLTEELEYAVKTHRENLFTVESRLLRLLGALAGAETDNTEPEGTAIWLRNWLDAEYASCITVVDMARRFGYSEKSVIRLFKHRFGITPHQYQIALRLDQAMWLLTHTEMSAEQIAVTVGYSEFSSFFRGFCKRFGVSPGQIRKKPISGG